MPWRIIDNALNIIHNLISDVAHIGRATDNSIRYPVNKFLCAGSRCSLSIVDDEIKDASTWHLSSKNTNGYTKMLPVRTMMWQNYNVTKSDDTFNTTLPKMITTNSFADSHTHTLTLTHTHTHKHTKKHTHTQTHTQLQQYWWQSLKTAITSAELWAVLDDSLSRQASLQQNFGLSSMTVFQDSHHFSRTLGCLWWQSCGASSSEAWARNNNFSTPCRCFGGLEGPVYNVVPLPRFRIKFQHTCLPCP